MLADIEAEIIGYLRMVIFDPSTLIERDTDLLAAGLDSIAMLSLLLFIEQQCGVCIPEETITEETIRSVKNIAAFVYALMPPDLAVQS